MSHSTTSIQPPLCIHEMFEAQAAYRPEALAVSCDGIHLTYAELDRLTNQLARLLRTHGVGPETLVGLCLDRSVEVVIGMLGIMKAGGAYVPLDPAYPPARLRMMIEDAGVQVMVTQERYARRSLSSGARCLCLDTIYNELAQFDDGAIERWTQPEHLVYVFYTSGSTGRPKGVIITHANTTYFAGVVQEALGINASDVCLQSASITYALHFRQIMMPLSQGAHVVIATEDEVQDPLALLHLIRREGVTKVDFVPSYLRRCTQVLSAMEDDARAELLDNQLRQIVTVGEALLSDLPRIWKHDFKHPAKLLNIIGQTESTGVVATYPIPDVPSGEVGVVPVGWAVPGVTIHLLDEALNPVPDGEAGELCIDSPGLARGYWRSPGLTAEKFILHPFADQPGQRIYRTGDLARRGTDGCLEFLGRKDFQVQVRGMRVELGDIEGALRQQTGVREAAVLAREDGPDDITLVACIVAEPGTLPTADTLRQALHTLLPTHMVPTAFRRLNALPYSPNGKVDQKALFDLEAKLASATVAPLMKKPHTAEWLYVPLWHRSAPAPSQPGHAADGPWLIFCDERGIGQLVAARLAERGHTVTTVLRGHVFTRRGSDAFMLRPTAAADYREMFDVLEAESRLPASILHLWNVSEQAEQEIAFGSLLRLAQALAARPVQQPIQLAVGVDGLHDVTGGEPIQPDKALLLGLCRSIPLEYPHIRCTALDVGADAPETLAGLLLAEMNAGLPAPDVAFRSRERWCLAYEPKRLPQHDPVATPLRDGGVYLLTGGLGGVALALADVLAQAIQRPCLVLTGRSAFPPRAGWQAWLDEHEDDDKTSVQIRAVQALEEHKAIVHIAQADVTDAAQMQALVTDVEARFGPIRGVIHAAGLTNAFRMIPFASLEHAANVFAPKVQGSRVLLEMFQDAGLDFMVFCSSISAVLGRLEQSDYCAANAFQDAIATACHGQRLPLLSINWDTWQEEGIAAEMSRRYRLEEMKGEEIAQGILPAEGKAVFLQLLRSLHPEIAQLVVSTRDLQGRLDLAAAHRASFGRYPAITYEQLHEGTTHAYIGPRNDTEAKLAGIWQEVLGTERIGVQDHFFACGGHSLRGMQVLARVYDEWHLKFSVRALFETPTIAGFAEKIQQRLNLPDTDDLSGLLAELDALSDEEASKVLNEHAQLPNTNKRQR